MDFTWTGYCPWARMQARTAPNADLPRFFSEMTCDRSRVRKLRRVVCDFDGFAVFCFSRRNELVSRIRFCSTTITNDCFDHALSFVEGWLDAQKTAASKDCCPCLLWRRILPVTAADSDRRK